MSVEGFGNYHGKPYEKIVREHLVTNGITMAIYHDQEFDPAYSDIKLTVDITEGDKADYVMLKCFCVATVHKGAYSGLPDACDAIVPWINANGHRPDGMPYETYVKSHSRNLPPKEWETEIFFPVKERSRVYSGEPAFKRGLTPGL